MSDKEIDFDDSFAFDDENFFDQTVVQNKDIFDKLFSDDFQNEEILTELSTDESLPQIILNYENYCKRDNRSNNSIFDYILGLINLMQKLSQIEDEIIDLWISSPKQTENCIFSLIFKLLPKCYIEVCSPKMVAFQWSSIKDIKMSLYESIAFRICELVLTLRESHFQFVETLLFKQLLSERTVCSILASDVLTFTARISTHPLCYQFCSVLMTISSHLKDSELPNISSLMNRLIPFLTSLELEYLLKDYDLIKYSRVWRIPNICRVLTTEQIKQYLEEFKTFIDNGKPLNKYDFNLLRNLLISNELDPNYRNYCFEKFFKVFVTQKESNFYSDFIDLITITLPIELNNTFIQKMFAKLNQIFSQTDTQIALDLVFIEKLMVFVTHLTVIQIPISMEKLSIRLISSYIVFIHKNSNNFYAKYLTLNALKEISLKSKLVSIVENCCKDEEVRQDFVEYLNKIKTNQLMDENEKIDYLQTIEEKLRNETEFNSNEVFIEKRIQQMREVPKVSLEDDLNSSDVNPMEVDSNNDLIDKLIESIEENVLSLKENRLLLKQNHKKGLTLIISQFNDFMNEMRDKS